MADLDHSRSSGQRLSAARPARHATPGELQRKSHGPELPAPRHAPRSRAALAVDGLRLSSLHRAGTRLSKQIIQFRHSMVGPHRAAPRDADRRDCALIPRSMLITYREGRLSRGEPSARNMPGLGTSRRVGVLSRPAWHDRRASGQYRPQAPTGSRSDRACAGCRLGHLWPCAAGGWPWVMSCLSRSAANAAL
jgi:hypothetical protein